MTWFVWVHGLRGPEPQKWLELFRDAHGRPHPYLAAHKLPKGFQDAAFHELEKIYPAPLDEQSQ